MTDDDGVEWRNEGRDDDRNRAVSLVVVIDLLYVVVVLGVLAWEWFA